MTSYLTTPPPPPSPRDGGIWDRRTGRRARSVAARRAELQLWIQKMMSYGRSGECVIAKRIDELEAALSQLRPEATPTPRPTHPWAEQWVVLKRGDLEPHRIAVLEGAYDDVAILCCWFGGSTATLHTNLDRVAGTLIGSRWKSSLGEHEVISLRESTGPMPRKLESVTLQPSGTHDSLLHRSHDPQTILSFWDFIAGGAA